jgi:nicotinamidase-related amidase
LVTDTFTRPVPRESALLTIDVQEDFARQIPGTRECVPAMRRVVEAYRQQGLPIVHVVRLYVSDGSNADLCRREMRGVVTPGSDGAELVDGLKPDGAVRLNAGALLNGELQELRENEWAMYKPRWDAFHGTPLEEHLRKHGVTTVSVVGCNFPNCPRATIYGASMRDFRINIFVDAISGVYDKGLEELGNIGVAMMRSEECMTWFGR